MLFFAKDDDDRSGTKGIFRHGTGTNGLTRYFSTEKLRMKNLKKDGSY